MSPKERDQKVNWDERGAKNLTKGKEEERKGTGKLLTGCSPAPRRLHQPLTCPFLSHQCLIFAQTIIYETMVYSACEKKNAS